MPNPPNLILAVLDTARADEVLQPERLPGIRALSERGTVFTTAISPAPWTLPSHASLFSGLMPNEHGMTGDYVLAGGHLHSVEPLISAVADRWVPAVLQQAGYRTFGASANPWITNRTGFGFGFDRLVETGPAVGNVRFDPSRKPRAGWLPKSIRAAAHETRRLLRAARPAGDSGATASLDAFRNWLGSESDPDPDRPFFAFFNFMEPHLPYVPSGRHAPASLRDRLRGARLAARLTNEFTLRFNVGLEELESGDIELLRTLYRGEIAGLDERLAELTLLADKAPGETVMVIVGDHGENLGDHHLLGHQTSVADTLLHVPLVVSGPGVKRGSTSEPVSTAAVAGTLLDIAGVPSSAARALLFDSPGERPDVVSMYESAYVEAAGARALADGPLAGDATVVRTLKTRSNAVRRGQLKLVARSDGTRSVYDMEADPGESRDLARDRPDLVSSFDGAPLWLEPPEVDAGPVSQELEEIERRLEALGYL